MGVIRESVSKKAPGGVAMEGGWETLFSLRAESETDSRESHLLRAHSGEE